MQRRESPTNDRSESTTRQSARDTIDCPACDREVAREDLLSEGCPHCNARKSSLYLVAAGLRRPEEVAQ